MLSQAALPHLETVASRARGDFNAGPRLANRIKSLFALIGLVTLAIPCAVVVAASWLSNLPLRISRSLRACTAPRDKTVVITGGKMTKSLELCRCFDEAGWRVVLCETPKYWLTGHRFSAAVHRFCVTPEISDPVYGRELARIVSEEGADLFVAVCSPASSQVEAIAAGQLPDGCDVMHVPADQIGLLDDKFQLAEAASFIGLPAPKSFLIKHHAQVDYDFLRRESRNYLLKSIAYDAVRRLDLTKLPLATPAATDEFVRGLPISDDSPWVMQEFIEGDEFCTHSTIRAGELLVHTCCRSSEFQVNYEHVEVPEIEDWVREFANAYSLTGQVSFDFIRSADDGRYYAIECNPRAHSAITAFHTQRQAVARAYAGGGPDEATIKPRKNARPTYWLYHELWRLLKSVASPFDTASRLRVIAFGKDAIFSWTDPLPFFMVHHWQIPLLLARDLFEGRGWIRIDFNIGKLVQAAGD